MGEPSLKDALDREIAGLGAADRRRVLEFARSLGSRPRGTAPSALLSMAGTMSESDVAEIEAAIEEGCEKVNPGGW
jgi:hypothetical protein